MRYEVYCAVYLYQYIHTLHLQLVENTEHFFVFGPSQIKWGYSGYLMYHVVKFSMVGQLVMVKSPTRNLIETKVHKMQKLLSNLPPYPQLHPREHINTKIHLISFTISISKWNPPCKIFKNRIFNIILYLALLSVLVHNLIHYIELR